MYDLKNISLQTIMALTLKFYVPARPLSLKLNVAQCLFNISFNANGMETIAKFEGITRHMELTHALAMCSETLDGITVVRFIMTNDAIGHMLGGGGCRWKTTGKLEFRAMRSFLPTSEERMVVVRGDLTYIAEFVWSVLGRYTQIDIEKTKPMLQRFAGKGFTRWACSSG